MRKQLKPGILLVSSPDHTLYTSSEYEANLPVAGNGHSLQCVVVVVLAPPAHAAGSVAVRGETGIHMGTRIHMGTGMHRSTPT